MSKHRIDNMYVADGLAEDCEELILKCSQVSKLSFEKFSDIWREMEFACIFHGRPSGSELAEFSEEALHIAKFFLVSNIDNNLEKSVAGLFLVYGILNLQPYPRLAPLRLVQEDVAAIEKLEYIARRERRHDILYILGEVLIRGPCQFHVSARERGLDYCIRKYFDGCTQHSIIGKRPTGVFHRHNEELDIIRELSYLEDRYEKAKKQIAGPEPDRSLSYADTRLAKDLQTTLKTVVSGIVVQDANNRPIDSKPVPLDHYDSVQAIKHKAMMNVVDPIKHLTGVDDRNKKQETSTSKTKTKKNKEYMKLLSGKPKRTSESDSPESIIKSPKPYPWSLRLFNEFEEEEPSTSKHKLYNNVLRTSPRVKKTSTSESPTKPDPGLMLIELETGESSNKNDNNKLDPPNTATPAKRSPRKNATPKRLRIDSTLSFEDSSDEPPAKKIGPKRIARKADTNSSISDTDSEMVKLTIDEIPLEFSAPNNNVEIEIIDLYKGKGNKKIIKFENGKQREIKANEQSVKVKSIVELNEPLISETTQKISETELNKANRRRKEDKGNNISSKLNSNMKQSKVNEPSTSKVGQKTSKGLRKHMKLTKLKSRIKRLGMDEVVDFESRDDSSD